MEGIDVVSTTISVVVVVGILVGTLIALRWVSRFRFRGNNRGDGTGLEVVDRQTLGRTGALVVVRYAGREHLIGVTESNVQHLIEGDVVDVDPIDLRNEDESGSVPIRILESLRDKTARR
ncbi:MAG: flagellar biosynthetic protein FliO [Acidimicrobiales bacterium]